jgi:predicted transcriptional regulator
VRQLPVLEGDRLLGTIRESDLLSLLASGEHSAAEAIGPNVSGGCETVTPQAPIAELTEKLVTKGCNMVLAVDGGRLCGVLTRIDLIDYLAGEK